MDPGKYETGRQVKFAVAPCSSTQYCTSAKRTNSPGLSISQQFSAHQHWEGRNLRDIAKYPYKDRLCGCLFTTVFNCDRITTCNDNKDKNSMAAHDFRNRGLRRGGFCIKQFNENLFNITLLYSVSSLLHNWSVHYRFQKIRENYSCHSVSVSHLIMC